MSCARNLVVCCQTNDFEGLFIGTRQIFGMCNRHGVQNPYGLFLDYTDYVTNFLRFGDREALVQTLHGLVWSRNQRKLALLLGYTADRWSSMMTFVVQ